jgi:hypothetical protein
MILERFNAILFIGDDVAQSIYAAFNILLRENLAYGSLQTWNMDAQEMKQCECDAQFLDKYPPSCLEYAVTSSEQVKENGESERITSSPYYTGEHNTESVRVI